jgi:hypothetical protein
MSSIPLDLQRRFERRWAARFLRPNPPTSPQKHQSEGQDQQPDATGKGERKTHRDQPAGFRSAPVV